MGRGTDGGQRCSRLLLGCVLAASVCSATADAGARPQYCRAQVRAAHPTPCGLNDVQTRDTRCCAPGGALPATLPVHRSANPAPRESESCMRPLGRLSARAAICPVFAEHAAVTQKSSFPLAVPDASNSIYTLPLLARALVTGRRRRYAGRTAHRWSDVP